MRVLKRLGTTLCWIWATFVIMLMMAAVLMLAGVEIKKALAQMPEIPSNQVIITSGITFCDTADQMMEIVQLEIDEGVEASIAKYLEFASQINEIGEPICGAIKHQIQIMITEILFRFQTGIDGIKRDAIIVEFHMFGTKTYYGYMMWAPMGGPAKMNREKPSGQVI